MIPDCVIPFRPLLLSPHIEYLVVFRGATDPLIYSTRKAATRRLNRLRAGVVEPGQPFLGELLPPIPLDA